MIKSENGKLEMSGIGEEIINDYITIVKGLYRSNLMTDELFCEIGASISVENDLGIFEQTGTSIQVDLDELKKQMEGE